MPSPLRGGRLAGAGGRLTEYVAYPPPPALRDLVAGSWRGQAGWSRRLRVLPDGCTELVWNGRELLVAGAVAHAVREPVEAEVVSVGVRLRPGAARTVFGCPANELPGRLEALHGRRARRWQESLAGDPRLALLRLVGELAGEPDRVALAAASLVAGGVSRLDAVGLSDRQLRRVFRDQVGYGPKTLHRVLRFQRFVRRLPAVAAGFGLAAVAADLGYADQSHLGRECLALSGSSPGALVRRWSAQREVGRNLPDR
ncbi:helix-turn-helix domain-containing protein [Fodinicola acaciae]|uniref:helix-turn-helix domain-containing protein n=1 Tax=Fodinicola acaciae TaxID=2681555 RepID=UPI0013CF8416|nr:helix-turn-helix domain-containing protein [Fodinicola acaciae]